MTIYKITHHKGSWNSCQSVLVESEMDIGDVVQNASDHFDMPTEYVGVSRDHEADVLRWDIHVSGDGLCGEQHSELLPTRGHLVVREKDLLGSE